MQREKIIYELCDKHRADDKHNSERKNLLLGVRPEDRTHSDRQAPVSVLRLDRLSMDLNAVGRVRGILSISKKPFITLTRIESKRKKAHHSRSLISLHENDIIRHRIFLARSGRFICRSFGITSTKQIVLESVSRDDGV